MKKFLLSLLTLFVATTTAWADETTYTFTSKSWADATSSWTSGQAGNQFQNGRGVQVTTGASGANATTNSSFSDVSGIEVVYSTNASKGKGSIVVQVGTGSAKTCSVTPVGTTDTIITGIVVRVFQTAPFMIAGHHAENTAFDRFQHFCHDLFLFAGTHGFLKNI